MKVCNRSRSLVCILMSIIDFSEKDLVCHLFTGMNFEREQFFSTCVSPRNSSPGSFS